MTFDNWASKFLGQSIDYDGVYGVQCVDLAKHFIKNVLSITPQSIGNAIEYYNKRKTSTYLTNNFTWIDNTATFVAQKGDLGVFKTTSGTGHICVCNGDGTTSYFYAYDENYPKGAHEPMTLTKHTYKNFLGVLRPKNQTNILNTKMTVTAKSGLRYYSSLSSTTNAGVLAYNKIISVSNKSAGEKTINGTKYTMAKFSLNNTTYYCAVKYLK